MEVSVAGGLQCHWEMTSSSSWKVRWSSLLRRQKMMRRSLFRTCSSISKFRKRTKSYISRQPFAAISSLDYLNPLPSSLSLLYFFTMLSNQCSSQRTNSSTSCLQSAPSSLGLQKGFSSSSLRLKISLMAVSSRSSPLLATSLPSCCHLCSPLTRQNHFLQLRNYQSSAIWLARFFSSSFSQFLSDGCLKSAVSGSSACSSSYGWNDGTSSQLSLSLKLVCLLVQGEYLRQELLLVLSPNGTRSICPSLASPSSFLESQVLSLFSYFLISSSMFLFCLILGGFSVEAASVKLSYLLISRLSFSLLTFSFCRKRMRSASKCETGAASAREKWLRVLVLFSCLFYLARHGFALYFFLMASAFWEWGYSLGRFSWKSWLCLMTSESPIILRCSLASRWSNDSCESCCSLSKWVEHISLQSVFMRSLLPLLTSDSQGLIYSLSLLIIFCILKLRSSMLDAFICQKCISFSAFRNSILGYSCKCLLCCMVVGGFLLALMRHYSLRLQFWRCQSVAVRVRACPKEELRGETVRSHSARALQVTLQFILIVKFIINNRIMHGQLNGLRRGSA